MYVNSSDCAYWTWSLPQHPNQETGHESDKEKNMAADFKENWLRRVSGFFAWCSGVLYRCGELSMIYPTKHELLATSGKYVDMMCTMKLCKGNKFMIGTSLAKPILCLSIIYYMEAKGCVSNSFQRKELIPFFPLLGLLCWMRKRIQKYIILFLTCKMMAFG